jgi:hypothetical protein
MEKGQKKDKNKLNSQKTWLEKKIIIKLDFSSITTKVKKIKEKISK